MAAKVSVNARFALLLPTVKGEKTTLKVQLAAGVRVVPQAEVTVKSAALMPEIVKLLRVTAVAPPLVKVTV